MSGSASVDEYRARLREALAVINDLKARVQAAERARVEPIAILGMGCRFPGGGEGPEAFREALRRGVDAVREIPATRWPAWMVPKDRPEVRHAALLDDIDGFDAAFFGISPREAQSLDPQQRLLLEVVWEALEDGGQRPDALMGSRTGVFVGIGTLDYQQRIVSVGPGALDTYSATGNLGSTAGGRLAFTLGLVGPCITVDTACSSSLVATHLACQSLRSGECDVAIVAGANALVSPFTMTMLSHMRALSPDGRCKTFDARANGYVRGEGCGVVILKRASDARRDGDRIRALIRGSAVNQDGRSTGLTTPNVLSQQALLQQALANARLTPSQIGFIEAHGTGTPLGDPIELDALRAVFGEPRPDGSTCVIGAVKTNIGHLEGAAGIAGLIKAALALEYEEIPGNLHFRVLNPRCDIEGTPFVLPTGPVPWKRGMAPRFAGISSFGISGTNAHVILEEAPIEPEPTRPSPPVGPFLLPLSAKSSGALLALSKKYAAWIGSKSEEALSDVTQTASERRAHHEYRLAVVGRTSAEVAEALASYAAGQVRPGVAQGRVPVQGAPKVVFVFPGQGSQWLGMGRQLLAEDLAFRQALEACDAAIRAEAGFSVLAELAADEASARLGDMAVVQPLLFAIEVALVATWRSFGVEPDVVVGHSMGEVAAAHVAGILSLADAAKVICRRSRLLKRVSGKGAMALVELTMAEAEQALGPRAARLGIAAQNGPRSTVLSGNADALEEVLAELGKRGVFFRRVKVDVASHSPEVDPLLGELREVLAEVRPGPAAISMRSTVTGGLLAGPELDAGYWVRNLREPVRLSQVTSALLGASPCVFVEISPHPILVASIEENLHEANREGAAIASLRRESNERRAMLEALAALYTHGVGVRSAPLDAARRPIVPLPSYPFQHERYWIEIGERRGRAAAAAGAHPLLGARVSPAAAPEIHCWEVWIDVKSFPYLADHRVQGEIVFPGAGYVEMALAAAAEVLGENAALLEDLSFEQMLALPSEGGRVVQVTLIQEGGGAARVVIASREEGATTWVTHAQGKLRVASAPAVEVESRRAVEERCPTLFEGVEHYARMEARGLSYGERFQGVVRGRMGEGEVVASVQMPAGLDGDAEGHRLMPALLDACFQAAAWAIGSWVSGKEPFVPVSVSRVSVHGRLGRAVWVHARLLGGERDGAPRLSLRVMDERGALRVEIGELRLQRLLSSAEQARDPLEGCSYVVEWRRKDLERRQAPAAAAASGAWLVIADAGGRGEAIAQLLRQRGDACVEVARGPGRERLGPSEYRIDVTDPDALRWMLAEAFGGQRACRGVVCMQALDAAPWKDTSADSLGADLRGGLLGTLRVTQAILRHGFRDRPKLFLVTCGAQAAGRDARSLAVSQSPLWGFGRTLAIENPELECTRIDLPAQPGEDDAARLLYEVVEGDGEDEIALRSEGRYVARLVRADLSAKATEEAATRREPAAGRPFRLEIPEPGVLDRFTLRPVTRRQPSRGEVEIEVEAAGLNFIDVLKAMGIYPGMDGTAPLLGGECAGRIVAVGEGVEGLHPGQEVIAAVMGAFATHVVAKAAFVVPKPPGLSFEQAAAIPGVFTTVHYALRDVGRARRGERILVHSATGGTGLAAIVVARALGLEVFATAGSEERRAYLRAMGIEHVMDSRSLGFADEIMRTTRGAGVDLVLNSLTGEAIVKGLEVLAPYGRFLELGKRDIYDNHRLGLLPFKKSLSYTAIDLAGMSVDAPDTYARLLREVVASLEDGTYAPLPIEVLPVSRADEAFRRMAQARHIGKLVVRMRDAEAQVDATRASAVAVRSDGTYLLTGGLGGLGLSLSQWLVDRGARHLALVGRSEPSEEARQILQSMRDAGADVRTFRVDVSNRAAVEGLIEAVERDMPPLRGIVHAAAVLADRTVVEMGEADLFLPLAPKVLGAWNLHAATRGRGLDMFVLYSSAAGLLGNPGQASYAAGNVFMDALARARVAEGLPGMSIQWGPFADVGLAAAEDKRGKRLATRGIESLTPEEGTRLFGRLLERSFAEIGLFKLSMRQWLEFYPQASGLSFFSELEREGDKHGPEKPSGFREAIVQAGAAERTSMLEVHVIEQIARVLRMDVSRIDRRAPFASLGMDSLTSLELRNRLEASLGERLSAALLFTYSTPAALAVHLIERMGPSGPAVPVVAEVPPAPAPALARDEVAEGTIDDDILSAFDASLSRVKAENLR
ncbi:SDR family NAD(P)-dependent oxidoreductase [Polyangium sorediatum]|uniref:Type I polyketide synthase n=1 Tax=Polyangium sorediatum TaxID=889274 RepID=A0ABT6NU88_9BACT|nr:type I polyketide synthase [Polyangium sorediatum]MDI1431901.1 type I polyketide synthase [Polyangium sorediatum]